ncbi:hypothetical protein HYG86_14880 [Alkalicella caledoniensis]|uniref:Uncharacterized protein n=1 Tax=Alkalicella caledoniensis TaxID=2731377 RepID=A0A7G9WB96_ALKCA|nr:hypothetical protein [Alkalicella caledoniensis]QNO15958.1 hypothetical protein HYG86_14880 [Alkalicella caledoniensis]
MRRKSWINPKKVMLLCSILFLGLMGTSYAYWNSSTLVNGTITLGEIKLGIDSGSIEFIRNESSGGVNNINISVNGNTIRLSGEVNKNFNAVLEFKVLNIGQIPFVIDSTTVNPSNSIVLKRNILSTTEKIEIEYKQGQWVEKIIIETDFEKRNQKDNQQGENPNTEEGLSDNPDKIVKENTEENIETKSKKAEDEREKNEDGEIETNEVDEDKEDND